jgi:hypothetical protein
MPLKSVLDWMFKLPPVERRAYDPWLIFGFFTLKDISHDQNYIYNKIFSRVFYGTLIAATLILIHRYLLDGALPNISIFYEYDKVFWMITLPVMAYHYILFRYNIDIEKQLISPEEEKKRPIGKVFSRTGWTAVFILIAIAMFVSQFLPHILPIYILKAYKIEQNNLLIGVASILDMYLMASASLCLVMSIVLLEKRFRWPKVFWRTELMASNAKE